MRKVRTDHGTRVARSIACVACGEKDTISFAPRDASRALCRRCAAEHLGVTDPEAGIRGDRPLTCTSCGREQETAWREPETFQCRDCVMGIETQQQDRSKRAHRTSQGVLRIRKGTDGGRDPPRET